MKVHVENLGVLKRAEFEVGDFTLICGDNNTGKTYAAYALYGFLSGWRQWLSVEIPKPTIDALLTEGTAHFDVGPERAKATLKAGCERYLKHLPEILAGKADRFKDTKFRVSVDDRALRAVLNSKFETKAGGSDDKGIVYISKDSGSGSISLLLNKKGPQPPQFSDLLSKMIADAVVGPLFAGVIPQPFMVSAERTGGAMFRDELDYRANKIPSGELVKNLLRTFAASAPVYPIPVQDNVNFMRRVEHVVKTDSFLTIDHSHILDEFADIIGGEIGVDGNGIIYFIPARRPVRLILDETSSAVRSLLILGLYLRHAAQPGDLLMVDEPELSLHIGNQRRIARLFAKLVNLGVMVFTTTHSTSFVKELNTLIMLNQDEPYLKKLAKEEKYRADELLRPAQLRVYTATQKDHLLEPAPIDSELGIEAVSFDDTINDMNRIQDAIVWGP